MEWQQAGEKFFLGPQCHSVGKLESSIFRITEDDETDNLFLVRVQKKFEFSYKVYGLDIKLIERIARTYTSKTFQEKTLGVLLSGVKGSGKTVTAKQLCNLLGLPVLIVTQNYARLPEFLNNIKQDIVVFIDEYEKIFVDNEKGDEQNRLLSTMDGALSNGFRRVFLLTSNDPDVNCNMLERPGRVRYHKKYKDLPIEIIMEIVDDRLHHKELREQTIEFISELKTITIDIMKAIIDEVNIHKEEPKAFESVFNVRKVAKTHGVYEVTIVDGVETETLLSKDYYGTTKFTADDIGNRFHGIGRVKQIINKKTVKVGMDKITDEGVDTRPDKPDIKTFRLKENKRRHVAFGPPQEIESSSEDSDSD